MSEALETPSSTTNVRQQVSDAEWQTRCDLAACYRLFVRFGWTDLIFTHLTARVPGEDNSYLINPYGLLFDEITASSLLKVDFDGNVLLGDFPVNAAGHAIHTAVFKNRADLNVSLHSHTRAGITVSTMQCGLLPLSQQANTIMSNVACHTYGLSVSTDDECARIGRDLGDRHALILHNHGLLTCGRNVAEAFLLMYNLEVACKVQVDALASGQALHYPDQSDTEALARYGKIGADIGRSEAMVWDALIRSLERGDTSYRD